MKNKSQVLRRGTAWKWASLTTCAAAALLLSAGSAVRAQDAADATAAKFDVELRDASMSDAIEMIFKAAGNPPHIIDDQARTVRIAYATWTDKQWDEMVRTLCNLYNFKMSRDSDSGTYTIEPREPPAPEYGAISPNGPAGVNPFGGGGNNNPFGGAQNPFGGGAPGNPFAAPNTTPNPFAAPVAAPAAAVPFNPFAAQPGPLASPPAKANTGGGPLQQRFKAMADKKQPEMRDVEQLIPTEPMIPQVQPGRGTTTPRTGSPRATTPAGDDEEEKTFHIIIVKHIYPGGIANLFGGSTITTEELVVPEGAFSQSSGGFGGGFGGGGFGGSSGGFGGGGFGGSSGGFGGGGFGGNTGGFGGGGFGGSSGGFGGGGFGGGSGFSSGFGRILPQADMDVYGLGF